MLISSRWEGGPYAALEALFSARPVISTPVGMSSDLLGEWLYSTPDEGAEQLARIARNGADISSLREKALDTLRALLVRGLNVHLTIAGQFRWRGGDEQVRRAIEGIREYVTILPPFRQDEAPDIYRRAHLLLHTKFNDPCPTVPIEAMSCGLPVIGTQSGGMSELVPRECGILVPVAQGWKEDVAGDPADLADAVERVMEKHPAMSDAARGHAVNTFDLGSWLSRHERIFHQVIEAR